MRWLFFVGLVLGLGLLALLGWMVRLPTVEEALAAGLLPIICASSYRPFTLAFYTLSWRRLLPPGRARRFGPLLRLRWIGESINSLLPVAQVGGDLTRARLLAARGMDGGAAGAAMIADIALGALTQAVFGLTGLAALAALRATGRLTPSVVIGSLALFVGSVALYAFLRLGPSRLVARLPFGDGLRRRAKTLAGGFTGLDAAMRRLARRPRALTSSAGWHLLGWFSHVGETWMVLALCDAPVSWMAALAIESLSSTARGAAFFVPGGLGVQEGAVLYLCRRLGLPLEAAVALGVVKRLRELVVGLPGLVAWVFAERAALGRAATRVRAPRSGSCADA
jgi:putative membrane protein